jgi:acyl-CoA thioester hydrolase
MPEFRFPIRHNECDAYGHLNNISYVRYIEEAILRSDASLPGSEPGAATVYRRGRIRAMAIEYLRPAYYGDTVALRMVSQGLEVSKAAFSIEFRRAGYEDLIASATVETIASESSPAQRATRREEREADAINTPNTGFTSWLVPEMAYAIRHRVTWHDLDVTRGVPEATMLGFADRCGLGVITAHGWPPERMVGEGFAIILRRREAAFPVPAQLGDDLEIATWVTDVKRVSAVRHYAIRRITDGVLLGRTDTLGVWVDLATGRPIRIPEKFLGDFASNVWPT